MAIEMVLNYKLVIRASSKSYRMHDVKHLELQKKLKIIKILLPEHNKISRCFFLFLFFKKFFGEHMSIYWATDTPVLDFW